MGCPFKANGLYSRMSAGAVQRELARLEESGLVTVRRLGTQKHYQANPDSPLFAAAVSLPDASRAETHGSRRYLRSRRYG